MTAVIVTDVLFSVQSLLVIFFDEIKELKMTLLKLLVVLSYLFKKMLDFRWSLGSSDVFPSNLEISLSIRVGRLCTAPRRRVALTTVPSAI